MTVLVDDLVPDQLWALVEPLLPAPPRPPYGGRRRTISDRNCFAAIVFMARTFTPWRLLPARELGCGSPATCWRRLTEWAKAGVFDQLHLEVLDRLGEQGRLDWSRASVDTMSVRAKRGGTRWAQIRRSWQAWEQAPPGLRRWWAAADRGGHRRQRQRHQHVPGGPGRRPVIRTPSGRRRTRPGKIHADKAYDSGANRAHLRRRGIRPRIARRGIESSTRLGRHRWKIERALSWLSSWRRLQVRWDRDSGRWFAFVLLACAVVCFNRLEPATDAHDVLG
jgi:transposase